MRFLKSVIAVLLLMAVGQGEAMESNGTQTKPEPKRLSQSWRDLQNEILKSPHIFPRPDIINQRYALVLKPVVIGHVLSTPSFRKFFKYYTKNLKPDSPLYNMMTKNVESALDSTFDLLIKQYGRLDADMDLWHGIRKRSVNELDFFLSDEFTNRLLQKTGDYLQRLEDKKTNKIVKRAIEILESHINIPDLLKERQGPTRTSRSDKELLNDTDNLKIMEALAGLSNEVRDRREVSDVRIQDYDELSFSEKLSSLMQDELVDPVVDKANFEVNRIKRAYDADGSKGALHAIFSQGEEKHNVVKRDDEVSKEDIIALRANRP